MIKPPSAREEQTVYLNTVGTFGVTSASYHYARFASLVQRLIYYLCSIGFVFRFADDLLILVETSAPGSALFEISKVLFFLSVIGFELKWEKAHGGPIVHWTGF
eukprot:6383746-Amphidinium_carterae.1